MKRILAIALLLVPALLLAHGGMREVKGTIVKVGSDSIVVKRAADNVDETVALGATTTYKVGKDAGTHADMKEGSRVVVHFGHDGKALEVHLPGKK